MRSWRGHHFFFTCAAAFLLVLLAFGFPAGNAQPLVGDWVVTGNETIEGRPILLNGNLSVQPGGSLTLRNVQLLINTPHNGTYGILVLPGGSLFIEGSTVAATLPTARYFFTVWAANFELRDSVVRGAGWCANGSGCFGPFPSSMGLHVASGTPVIERTEITGSAFGVTLQATVGARILDNNIHGNDREGLHLHDANALVRGNIIQQTYAAVGDTSGIAIIAGENIQIEDNAITLEPSSIRFPSGQGIGAVHPVGLKVLNNTVTASRGITLRHGSDITVFGNDVHHIESGIGSVMGRNVRIEKNRVARDVEANPDAPTVTPIGAERTNGAIIAHNEVELPSLVLGPAMTIVQTNDAWVGGNTLKADVTDPSTPDGQGLNGCFCVVLSSSSRNTVTANRLVNTWAGVMILGNSTDNVVSHNEIDALRGIIVESSNRNALFGNAMLGEALGSYDDGNNSWTGLGGGNYWKSAGAAAPHDISPSGRDPSPLKVAPPLPSVAAPRGLLIPHVVPIKPYEASSTATLIGHEVRTLDSGSLRPPAGKTLLIDNSTITGGARGVATIVAYEPNSHVVIRNSTLIADDDGFGFMILVDSPLTNDLTIIDSHLIGVHVEDQFVRNLLIENSTIEGHTYMLVEAPAESVRVFNSTFQFNGNNLQIASAKDIKIIGNRFGRTLKSSFHIGGLEPDPETVDIRDNRFDGSWTGFTVMTGAVTPGSTARGTVAGNVFKGGATGLGIRENGYTIHGNDFVDNVAHAFGGPGLNIAWDKDGRGNHWGGFEVPDANKDGIGDSPYDRISGQHTDRYPLMNPVHPEPVHRPKTAPASTPQHDAEAPPTETTTPDADPDHSSEASQSSGRTSSTSVSVTLLVALGALFCMPRRP